ncbi:hypothetical protein ACLB2K_066835 [Fragaria x ananassa]
MGWGREWWNRRLVVVGCCSRDGRRARKMMLIQQQFISSYDPELHLLAGRSQSHKICAGCFVNGVKFVTSERDEAHVTQNNGFMVEATLERDDESGPSELTTDHPNEPYQEESPHVVLDTEDICVNNQHVSAIIGYIPITPSKLNSLQRKPNYDDDGFTDDEYIEEDGYSDQTKEDDDSDDSDYYEYD